MKGRRREGRILKAEPYVLEGNYSGIHRSRLKSAALKEENPPLRVFRGGRRQIYLMPAHPAEQILKGNQKARQRKRALEDSQFPFAGGAYLQPVSFLMATAYRRDMGISVPALSFMRMVKAPAVHGAISAR
jgi:hypothetical protein